MKDGGSFQEDLVFLCSFFLLTLAGVQSQQAESNIFSSFLPGKGSSQRRAPASVPICSAAHSTCDFPQLTAAYLPMPGLRAPLLYVQQNRLNDLICKEGFHKDISKCLIIWRPIILWESMIRWPFCPKILLVTGGCRHLDEENRF